jgi:hypothetical protein
LTRNGKRVAREYSLELVFVERSGRRERELSDMPVRIIDADGRVVFEAAATGPRCLARLPKGRYMVSTRWDAWCPSRPVTVQRDKQRVVFAWSKPRDAAIDGD